MFHIPSYSFYWSVWIFWQVTINRVKYVLCAGMYYVHVSVYYVVLMCIMYVLVCIMCIHTIHCMLVCIMCILVCVVCVMYNNSLFFTGGIVNWLFIELLFRKIFCLYGRLLYNNNIIYNESLYYFN